MKLTGIARFALVCGLAIFLNGCATKALWETGDFARYHEPKQPPELRLAYSERQQDVLVQYVERLESGARLRKRAYWLYTEVPRIQQRHKPRFVSSSQARGLEPIPVVDSAGLTNASSFCGMFAVVSTNGDSFALWATNRTLGSFDLPVYEDALGKTKRVLLTPPAVVADITIVGAAVAIVTLPAWWEGLNGVVH